MDIDDFRSILESSGVDVWTFIDTAIAVASLDFGSELKHKRDKIVEMLYASSSSSGRCSNCDFDEGRINNGDEIKQNNILEDKGGIGRVGIRSPSTTPRSIHGDEDEDDDDLGLFDDEQKRVLEIKQQLDLDQPEDDLVVLLQTLADMDITMNGLRETDIGRHVNDLRKHPSNEVRKLVKQLVRKWKEIVDEWVRLNPQRDHASSALMDDGDSPQQKISQNGHHQVPDFAYSPNPHDGSSRSDRNISEPERKPKPVPRRDAPPKPIQQSSPASASYNAQRQKEQQKEDSDRLASASKRLQANYREAENAKKQRTIQVMDIHELPKPKNKNTFFPRNKGGGSQGHGGRHW